MTFSEVIIKRMNGLIETANKNSAWEMEAAAEMMKAVHLLNGVAQATTTPASPGAGYTEAEGYAASLRQQAKWVRECKLDGTIDADELDAAATFIERIPSVAQTALLDQAWEEINALGGSGNSTNLYDDGVVKTAERALDIIEKLGGMDPKQRAASPVSP